MTNKPIPYYIKEKISREFHFTAKSNEDIASKYGVAPKTISHISKDFPPEYFSDEPGKAHRSLWIISLKLQQVANSGDMETLHKVAKILSRV